MNLCSSKTAYQDVITAELRHGGQLLRRVAPAVHTPDSEQSPIVSAVMFGEALCDRVRAVRGRVNQVEALCRDVPGSVAVSLISLEFVFFMKLQLFGFWQQKCHVIYTARAREVGRESERNKKITRAGSETGSYNARKEYSR